MRHLSPTEFCTVGPQPIEHIGCLLEIGKRITVLLTGWVIPSLARDEIIFIKKIYIKK